MCVCVCHASGRGKDNIFCIEYALLCGRSSNRGQQLNLLSFEKHFFQMGFSCQGQHLWFSEIVLCGRDSTGTALALTFHGRCSILTPFHKHSKKNVARRSKMNVRHSFVVEITAFWGTNAALLNAMTFAFAWQVQHCETVWVDVVGVLLACACLRAEVRPSLLIFQFSWWKATVPCGTQNNVNYGKR